jgi:hypothetical protein
MEMETGIITARQACEQPLRESDATRETEGRPNQPKPSPPKDETTYTKYRPSAEAKS